MRPRHNPNPVHTDWETEHQDFIKKTHSGFTANTFSSCSENVTLAVASPATLCYTCLLVSSAVVVLDHATGVAMRRLGTRVTFSPVISAWFILLLPQPLQHGWKSGVRNWAKARRGLAHGVILGWAAHYHLILLGERLEWRRQGAPGAERWEGSSGSYHLSAWMANDHYINSTAIWEFAEFLSSPSPPLPPRKTQQKTPHQDMCAFISCWEK